MIVGLASRGPSQTTSSDPSKFDVLTARVFLLSCRPAFFAIARELRLYTVGMARKEIKTPKNDVTAAQYEITHEVSDGHAAGRPDTDEADPIVGLQFYFETGRSQD